MKCLACDNPVRLLDSGKVSSVPWCDSCRTGWLEGHDLIAVNAAGGGLTNWGRWVDAGRPGLDATPTRTEPGRCDCGAAKVRHAGHSTWCSKY